MSIASSSVVVAGNDATASQYNDLRKDVIIFGGDYLVSATGNDTYSVTMDSSITAYVVGMILKLKADVVNTQQCCVDVGITTTLGTATMTIASPGVVTFTSHGLVEGDIVRFTTTGALPTGLAINTNYFVITAGLTANAFQLSATKGGSAINTTGTQSGTHTLYSRTKHIKSMSGANPRSGDVIVGPNVLEWNGTDWILLTRPQGAARNYTASGNTTGTTVIAHGLGKTPDEVELSCSVTYTANIYSDSEGSYDSGGQTCKYQSINNGAGTIAYGVNASAAYGPGVSSGSFTGTITADDTNVTITWSGTSYPFNLQLKTRVF